MTHRIFYGTDFKLTDSDKKMFSREGYECKENDASHSQKPFGFRLPLALTPRMQKLDRIGKPDLQKIIDQSQCKDQREKENGISGNLP